VTLFATPYPKGEFFLSIWRAPATWSAQLAATVWQRLDTHEYPKFVNLDNGDSRLRCASFPQGEVKMPFSVALFRSGAAHATAGFFAR